MRLRFTALAPLAVTLACASSQTLPDTRAQSTMAIGSAAGSPALMRYFRDVNSVVDTLPVPAARVWAQLPAAYASVGIPLSVADSTSRTLGALRVPMRNRLGTRQLSAFVDCGLTPTGTPRANSYVVSVTALTQVQDVAGGKSVVRTAVAASARDDAASSPDLQCGSSGRIEQMLTDALRAGI
jgi:hypothetical protein